MVAEYIARISGDTSQLKKELQNVRGDLKRLNDDEVILKFEYNGNIKEFNKVFNSIKKQHPELTIQFQYDVNKKILAEKQKELSDITAFKVDFDNNKTISNINHLVKEINLLFQNGVDDDVLKGKIDHLVKYINTSVNSGLTVDDDSVLKQLDSVNKYLNGYVDKTRSKKNFQLFNIDKNLTNTLSKTKDEIENIEGALTSLKKKGASDANSPTVIQAIEDDIKILKSDIADMKDELSSISGENFEDLTKSIQISQKNVEELTRRLEILYESLDKAPSKKNGIVDSLFGMVNSSSNNEQSAFLDLSTGYISKIVEGTRDANDYQTAREIYDEVKKWVNASFHTHAVDNLASVDARDLRSFARDFEESTVPVATHFIGARRELSKIDLSVFEDAFDILDLATQMDEQLIHMLSSHFDIRNMSQAKKNIDTDSVVDQYMSEIIDGLKTYNDFQTISPELGNQIKNAIKNTLENISFSDINLNDLFDSILNSIIQNTNLNADQLNILEVTFSDIFANPIADIIKRSIVGPDLSGELNDVYDEYQRIALKKSLNQNGFNADDIYQSIPINLSNPQEVKAKIASFFLGCAEEVEKGQEKVYYALNGSNGKNFKELRDSTRSIVDVATDATNDAQDSNSPSKVAEKLGEYWGEGYAQGIKKHKNDVEQSVRELIQAGVLTTEDLQEDLDNLLAGNFGNRYKALLNPLQNILSDSFNNKSLNQDLTSKKLTSDISDFGEECQRSKKYCDDLLDAIQQIQSGVTGHEISLIAKDFPELADFIDTFPEDIKPGNADFLDHWYAFLETLPRAQEYLELLNKLHSTELLTLDQNSISSGVQEDISTVDKLGNELQETGQKGEIAGERIADGIRDAKNEVKKLEEDVQVSRDELEKTDLSAINENSISESIDDLQAEEQQVNAVTQAEHKHTEELAEQNAIRQAFLADIHQTPEDKLNQQMIAGIREVREEQEKLNDTIEEQSNVDYVVPSEEKLLPMVIETTNAIQEQMQQRMRLQAAERAFQKEINQSNESKINKDIAETLRERREEQERLNEAKKEEQVDNSIVQDQNNITAATDDAARAIREYVEEFDKANRSADATKEWVEGLAEVGKQSKEAKASLKEAIEISKSQDAGSGLELISDALAEINQEAKEADASVSNVVNNQGGLSVSKTISELEGYQNKLAKVNRTDWFDDFVDKTEDASTRLTAKIEELRSLQISEIVDPEEIKRIRELEKEAKQLAEDVKNGVDKLAKPVSRAGLSNQISNYLSKNTKLSKEFRRTLEEWMRELENPTGADRLKEIYVGFQNIQVEARKAGQEGKTFFDKISDRLTDMNSKFIARFFSFQDLLRYGRQAVDVIRDLDTQLVDLRKTTTMNNTELEQFYSESNDIAKQLGTTTSQIIAQAAAWSRLGYATKEEAERMAELSSQFAAISPGMSLDDATDGLVSTMKAFHVDVEDTERDIMDNVNRIGNTFATSNGEIMEMLKRSSAAMAAANNTIEETIALESAAVQITRNAETTGTAFRTISMRIRGKQSLPPYTVMYMLCA